MKIITRQEAIAKGLKTYFTGKPCKNNHVCERRVSGECYQCNVDRSAAWRAENPERLKELKASWKTANGEWEKQRNAAYHARPEVKARKNKQLLERLRKDIQFKIAHHLRTRLRQALSANHPGSKNGSAVRNLGCSIAEFKIYIEEQLQPGMTWQNWTYDTWHLDHKKPLAAFDLSDPAQLREACHYTNLRPLWGTANMRRPKVRRR